LRQQMRFEGQAAMELEFALDKIKTDETYEWRMTACEDDYLAKAESGKRKAGMILDWSPMVEAILVDMACGVTGGEIAAKFHKALAEAIVTLAKTFGVPRIALSGGSFQNRYLVERTVKRLRDEEFLPYWHQRIPPNDGGIALGQVVAAKRESKSS